MTDWMPWGFAFMAGTLATLVLILRALARPPPHDLRAAWWALGLTVAASLGAYALHVLFGECWLWYARC